MEIFDKAPELSRIDPGDVVAIAEAHGGGGAGFGGGAGGTGGGMENAPGR